ncbi:peptide deformylase [Algibacillus agarilyticus]|uniref:peptide deformylase n=1 Tax=Algibacillus agarilyticus TaxID=2234133 RepID=UPI000DD0B98F|nr:peptide deformylase [Algibacillus agarilyticus]
MLKVIAQVGEDVLRTPASPVIHFDSKLQSLVDDLLETMLNANGIGIAAPQVFIPSAIMIIASRANARYPDAPDMDPLVMINPVITPVGQSKIKGWEGCLSVPGLRGFIPRYESIDVKYQDVLGQHHAVQWSGFLARIVQHEHDHLVGKTWLDRVESMTDVIAESVFLKQLTPEK